MGDFEILVRIYHLSKIQNESEELMLLTGRGKEIILFKLRLFEKSEDHKSLLLGIILGKNG